MITQPRDGRKTDYCEQASLESGRSDNHNAFFSMDTPVIDTSQIAVLLNVVSTGSLSAAARKMGIAPMAATRRLASLEEALGVRLVHRSTRSVSLTPEGEAFLPYANAVFDAIEAGRSSVAPSKKGANGLLRVTASGPIGRFVVTPLLPKLLKENPGLRVDLLISDNVVDIVSTGIDVAVRTGELQDSTLVATLLGAHERVLCASPGYLRSRGTPATSSDLANHDCILQTGSSQWRLLIDGHDRLMKVSGRVTCSNFDAIHDACLIGGGLAVLSAWHVGADLAAGKLVQIHLSDASQVQLPIWAVYPTKQQVLPKVRIFVEAMKHALALNG